MGKRYLGALALTATMCVVATACGSSSKSTSSGSSSASGSTAPAAPKTPITIGVVGTFSGPLASSSVGAKDTIQAWAAYVNDKGGINGQPVNLMIKDDAGSSTTALAAVQELLQSHPVAILDSSTKDVDWAATAEKSGVPVVGNGINLPFVTNQDFFSSSTTLFAGVYGVMELGKRTGPKQGILYCSESPVCAASSPLYKQMAPGLGMSIPYTQGISGSAPDYTAVCQALKSSGVDTYVMVHAAAVIARVAPACLQQGVTAKIVEASAAIFPSLLGVPGIDGMLSVAVDFPFIDSSTPATAEFHTALDKFGPPNLVKQSGTVANALWSSLQVIATAVKAGGPGAVTPESVKKGLYTFKGETVGGLTPPLTYVPGKVNLVNCYFVLGIDKGQFTEPDGLKTTCAPDAVMADVAKTFAAAAH